ncbi:thermonuclease family protein [Amycolatopsis acidicola]|uniref:Thermonuclease family protein n=1 Tax=Amycolatopsis acidicola TaxID=2596893 RepID=A0A5N0VJM7_9PSEU|nr:thermonuclease family protein [Amycolatopsis acidicola]KAA9166376.1 thermonuclease family protein [Amycolatopsis acidicola]
MTLTLIKGTYRIVGASPDGDSVRFYPDNPGAFAAARIRARLNSKGGAQLRLDGIDALETHYQAQNHGGQWRQPADLGQAAAAGLLSHLGFKKVTRDEDGTVTASTPDRVPGHIMTRFADKYGRAVAIAFPGQRSGRAADGSEVNLDAKGLRASANYTLLADGLVYPTFYSKLYLDLRQAMSEAAVAAREAGKGVWADDVTGTGFRLKSRTQLRDELVILPKLFRRLVDYLGLDESGGVSLAGFADYLDTRDDRLFTVPAGHATELATLVEVKRQNVRLTVEPEQIVFAEA